MGLALCHVRCEGWGVSLFHGRATFRQRAHMVFLTLWAIPWPHPPLLSGPLLLLFVGGMHITCSMCSAKEDNSR